MSSTLGTVSGLDYIIGSSDIDGSARQLYTDSGLTGTRSLFPGDDLFGVPLGTQTSTAAEGTQTVHVPIDVTAYTGQDVLDHVVIHESYFTQRGGSAADLVDLTNSNNVYIDPTTQTLTAVWETQAGVSAVIQLEERSESYTLAHQTLATEIEQNGGDTTGMTYAERFEPEQAQRIPTWKKVVAGGLGLGFLTGALAGSCDDDTVHQVSDPPPNPIPGQAEELARNKYGLEGSVAAVRTGAVSATEAPRGYRGTRQDPSNPSAERKFVSESDYLLRGVDGTGAITPGTYSAKLLDLLWRSFAPTDRDGNINNTLATGNMQSTDPGYDAAVQGYVLSALVKAAVGGPYGADLHSHHEGTPEYDGFRIHHNFDGNGKVVLSITYSGGMVPLDATLPDGSPNPAAGQPIPANTIYFTPVDSIVDIDMEDGQGPRPITKHEAYERLLEITVQAAADSYIHNLTADGVDIADGHGIQKPADMQSGAIFGQGYINEKLDQNQR